MKPDEDLKAAADNLREIVAAELARAKYRIATLENLLDNLDHLLRQLQTPMQSVRDITDRIKDDAA